MRVASTLNDADSGCVGIMCEGHRRSSKVCRSSFLAVCDVLQQMLSVWIPITVPVFRGDVLSLLKCDDGKKDDHEEEGTKDSAITVSANAVLSAVETGNSCFRDQSGERAAK